jgi:hypothetical protein
MANIRMIAFATALTLTGAAMSAAPAAAKPDPDRAISLWDPFDNNGCFVTDAAHVTTLDTGCQAHLTLRTVDGAFAQAMYQDHGELPAGATLPSTATVNDISYELPGVGLIRCSETITPSGEYKSKCYFNVQTQR